MTDSVETEEMAPSDNGYWNNVTNLPYTGQYAGTVYTQGTSTGTYTLPTQPWIPTDAEIDKSRLDAIEVKLDAMMKILEDLRETIEMIAIPVTCP